MTSHITGIGGVFFRSKNPESTRNWYNDTLGLKSESWGATFTWRNYDTPELTGSTAWGPFANESEYFGNSSQEFMINYRVANMDALLTELTAKGIKPVKELESNEYGKFVWIDDIDGRRIELWEPSPET